MATGVRHNNSRVVRLHKQALSCFPKPRTNEPTKPASLADALKSGIDASANHHQCQ